MLRTALLVAFITLSPVIAGAEPCGKRVDFIEYLRTAYDESPVTRGLTVDGKVLEILASKTGTWTIIVTAPSGETCGIAAGEALSPVPESKAQTLGAALRLAGDLPRVHQHHHKPK